MLSVAPEMHSFWHSQFRAMNNEDFNRTARRVKRSRQGGTEVYENLLYVNGVNKISAKTL